MMIKLQHTYQPYSSDTLTIIIRNIYMIFNTMIYRCFMYASYFFTWMCVFLLLVSILTWRRKTMLFGKFTPDDSLPYFFDGGLICFIEPRLINFLRGIVSPPFHLSLPPVNTENLIVLFIVLLLSRSHLFETNVRSWIIKLMFMLMLVLCAPRLRNRPFLPCWQS